MVVGQQSESSEQAKRVESGSSGYWWGPVAAIRPWLLQKCLGLLIATDVVVLMTERGARYGIDGFNVAHFAWLDRIQPLPTARWYVGILMLVAVLALLQVFLPFSRVRGACLALLYTYGWAMSRHDSYLHHYLTTLMLTCSLFFPRVTIEELVGQRSWPALVGLSRQRLGLWVLLSWIALLAYRIPAAWNTGWGPLILFTVAMAGWAAICWRSVWSAAAQTWLARPAEVAGETREIQLWEHWLRSPPLLPWLSAPGYRMLGATVGVVYIYTSIAKMDAEWCSGYTIQKVGDVPKFLGPVAQAFARWGLPTEWFWSLVATAVIPLELTIAAAYLVAVRQDEPRAVGARRLGLLGWCLAMALHTNNEMMGLTIQWFSYYMMFLAFYFLLPAGAVWRLGMMLVVPAREGAVFVQQWCRPRVLASDLVRLIGTASAAVAGLCAVGWWSRLPGPAWALPLAGGVVLATVAIGASRGSRRTATEVSVAGLLTALFLLLLFSASSVRFDYYRLAGRTHQKMIVGYGFPAASTSHALRNVSIQGAPLLGDSSPGGHSLGGHSQSNKSLSVTANDVRGDLAGDAGERPLSPAADQSASQELAIENFRRALEFRAARPGDRVEVLTNLGLAYRHLGNDSTAVRYYQEALLLADETRNVPPNVLFLVHYNLGVCYRLQGLMEQAGAEFERSLQLNPRNSDALVNLGQIHAELGSWSAAIVCYEAAQKLEPNAADIQQLLGAARAAQQNSPGESSPAPAAGAAQLPAP